MNIQSLRGMKEILPPENTKYEYFIKTATDIAKRYGFEFVQTPILELTSLFQRSVGDSSDIVGKEMYSFVDKGKNEVSLRPEGTAGVVRSFCEQKLDRIGGIRRFYYYGPMFRYERPQKGRFRQFHQFGCESFGESLPVEDVNIILMLCEIFDVLNIKYSIKLNSLGCEECIPAYKKDLVSFLDTVQQDLCEDCLRRKSSNPIRTLDCKNKKCQSILKDAPKMNNSLCSSCQDDIKSVQKALNALGISYEMDSNLVRGLDYYNKSAFEFIDEDGLAIAGGGRYDKLVEMLGGKSTPAIGFGIGIERVLNILESPKEVKNGYFLGSMSEVDISDILIKLAYQKRKTDKLTLSVHKKSLKSNLKQADKIGARYCAVIGEDELQDGTIWVKDLVEKKEKIVRIEDF